MLWRFVELEVVVVCVVVAVCVVVVGVVVLVVGGVGVQGDCVLDLGCNVLCKNPYVMGKQAFGCGQCLPCRINRRRMWASRIVLESLIHESSVFITLTYALDRMTFVSHKEIGSLATLVPKDVCDWLKRLRKRVYPGKVRYFLVGEYGDVSKLPHYHVALFGYPRCDRFVSEFSRDTGDCCGPCNLIRDTWGKGRVDSRVLCLETANYIAGYTVKKMTRVDDDRLEGRHPEFARMSSVPGIGRDALWDIGSEVLHYEGSFVAGDVPAGIRRGRGQMPLGRYLRRELRKIVGREPGAPQVTLDAMAEEMRPVWDVAKSLAQEAPAIVRKEIEAAHFVETLNSVNAGRHAQLDWRQANLGRKKL